MLWPIARTVTTKEPIGQIEQRLERALDNQMRATNSLRDLLDDVRKRRIDDTPRRAV